MKKCFFSTASAAVLAGLLTLGVGCTVREAQNALDTVKQTPQAVVSQEPEITSEITPAAIPETEPPSLPELEDVKVYATAPDTWLLTFSEDEILRNPASAQTVEASRAGEPLVFEFAGRKFQLSYDKTYLIDDVVGSDIIDYTVLHDGIAPAGERSDDSVSFLEDGSLQCLSLYDNPIVLETGGKTDNASVRKAIEELFKDEVDFAKYEFCDIKEPNPEGGGFYTTFKWLNKKNGIPIDWGRVEAWINEDGAVDFFLNSAGRKMIDPNELPDDLSVERYMPHFEKKLYELYGDGLADYELAGAQISRINGSACLVVSFGIRTFGDAIGLAVIIG